MISEHQPDAAPIDRMQTSIAVFGLEFRATGSYPFLFLACLAIVACACIRVNLKSYFWLDEVFTGSVSCQPDFTTMIRLVRHDIHPVLYHLMTYSIFRVFGCHLWIIRCISLVSSLAAGYLLLRQVARRHGNIFLAAALIFGNPTFWFYAFEARAYSLLFLLGTCVLIYGFSSKPGDQTKAVAFAFLAGLLHYLASFLMPVLLAIVVFQHRPILKSRSFVISFLAAGALLAGYYALHLPYMMTSVSMGNWIPSPLDSTKQLFSTFLLGNMFSAPIMIIIIFMTFVKNTVIFRERNKESHLSMIIFILFSALLYIVSFVKPMFMFRYTYFLVPFFIFSISIICRITGGVLRNDKHDIRMLLEGSMFLLPLYLCANLPPTSMLLPLTRYLQWQQAAASMTCSPAHPCGFVLDDSLEPSLSNEQYKALANFFAKEPGSFQALMPDKAQDWLHNPANSEILYIQSFNGQLDLRKLISNFSLQCNDYRKNTVGAVACHKS